MKKIILMVALFATGIAQVVVANPGTSSQTGQILSAYYQLKDNLVKGDPATAAASAEYLIIAVKGSDTTTIDGNTQSILLKDAIAISQTKDLKLQREKFAILSNNMIELAKRVKFTPEPVYRQYCPMKKASWLSHEKVIKNPYYGNAMLTCGSVIETL